jgi:EAL domain-containing protein (putative c-di-GMP-specific phosphodiesterase class I)
MSVNLSARQFQRPELLADIRDALATTGLDPRRLKLENSQDTAIVRSIVALAKAFGLSVTGEGIETSVQREQLRELNCDRGQGYLFARPQPPELIERLFAADAEEQPRAA